ncbi:MAG TPA: DUF1036 domain-containing protein [Beijerinckiaceae bacterium]|nr:DUF1036 domain-containing protein [Beijerinckiaceae bacterium]
MRKLIAACVFLILASSAASADIIFCNDYPRPVFAAWAYKKGSDWYSHGWLKVLTGSCRSAGLSVPMFYYRGETDWFAHGHGKRMVSWGNGPKKFSVTDKAFDFKSADVDRRGARYVKFTVSLHPDHVSNPIEDTVRFKADGSVTQTVVVNNH